MKNPLSISLSLVLFAGFHSGAVAQLAINLGTAASFGVLGSSTVTNTGYTVINGNLGVSPGTAITGFGPGVVNGTTYSAGAVAAQAQADALTAYNVLAGEASTQNLTGQNLGGLTLGPGVYHYDAAALLTGTLTLDASNNPNARFHFQFGSTLTAEIASQVTLLNGASASNVYWQVGSSQTVLRSNQFVGNVLANASITLGTDTVVDGRLFALNGAVTLDTNTVSVPSAVPEPSTYALFAALAAFGAAAWRRGHFAV
jgi:hypothetical protein